MMIDSPKNNIKRLEELEAELDILYIDWIKANDELGDSSNPRKYIINLLKIERKILQACDAIEQRKKWLKWYYEQFVKKPSNYEWEWLSSAKIEDELLEKQENKDEPEND